MKHRVRRWIPRLNSSYDEAHRLSTTHEISRSIVSLSLRRIDISYGIFERLSPFSAQTTGEASTMQLTALFVDCRYFDDIMSREFQAIAWCIASNNNHRDMSARNISCYGDISSADEHYRSLPLTKSHWKYWRLRIALMAKSARLIILKYFTTISAHKRD